MIVYKALAKTYTGLLYSFNYLNRWSKHHYVQQYFVNSVNRPKLKNSRIFVFKRLTDAKEAMTSFVGSVEIWRCEAKDCIKMPNRDSVEYFSRNYWLKPTTMHAVAPKGTYGCKTLKLIKRVH